MSDNDAIIERINALSLLTEQKFSDLNEMLEPVITKVEAHDADLRGNGTLGLKARVKRIEDIGKAGFAVASAVATGIGLDAKFLHWFIK